LTLLSVSINILEQNTAIAVSNFIDYEHTESPFTYLIRLHDPGGTHIRPS